MQRKGRKDLQALLAGCPALLQETTLFLVLHSLVALGKAPGRPEATPQSEGGNL